MAAVEEAGVRAAAGPGYVQQQYVVSGCSDPPLTDAAYAALAGLNFTGIFGEGNAASAAGAAAQAALCAAHGMQACLPSHLGATTVPLSASVKGYFLKDEPHAQEFAACGAQAAAIRARRPGALVFVNMLGSDDTTFEGEVVPRMEHWWGVKTYKEYTDGFLGTVKPDILCFDQYPTFGDCGAGVGMGAGAFYKNGLNYSHDTRNLFLYNLQYINNRSSSANLTFWNYFHSGWRVDVCGPSEGKVAWQMFASALHGSRGLLHFVVTPGPGDVPKPKPPPNTGGAAAPGHTGAGAGAGAYPLGNQGRRGGLGLGSGDFDHGYPGLLTFEGRVPPGPVYAMARRLDAVFRAWGPTLMKLATPPGGQVHLRYVS